MARPSLPGLNLAVCYNRYDAESGPCKTRSNSITLPLDLAYASVSEVVRDGVCALLERDAAVEHRFRDEVVVGHQEYLADPSQGVPAEEIS